MAVNITDELSSMLKNSEFPLYERAVMFAAAAHSGTTRKGSRIPYLSHPVEAAAIVAEMTDDEELIDLKELNRGDTLTHKSTSGLAYRAGDLYDWAKSSSWDTSTNVLICRQPDGSDYYMYYRDFADKIATGELKFVFGSDEDEGTENTKDILSMLSGRE